MAGPIRQPINIPALEAWLDKNCPTIGTPLDIKQFGYGQSNPTYLLTSPSGLQTVLRKKPPGTLVSKTAHAVEREYKVLKALGPTDVPVPKTYCLCEDVSVIGTPFYVMEFVKGRIFEDPAMPELSKEERRKCWREAVRTLGRLHRVDFRAVGLEGFGKVGGFYTRQTRTLGGISKAQAERRDIETNEAVGMLPHFDQLTKFFAENLPQDRTMVIHGDFKIDNLIFHPTEPRVIGILDWELSTLGHPLSDLSNLLSPFVLAVFHGPQLATGQSFDAASLPSREEIIGWYEEDAGWKLGEGEGGYGDAFVLFRNAVISQGIKARWAVRQASSAKAVEYGNLFPRVAQVAWEVIQSRERGRKAKL